MKRFYSSFFCYLGYFRRVAPIIHTNILYRGDKRPIFVCSASLREPIKLPLYLYQCTIVHDKKNLPITSLVTSKFQENKIHKIGLHLHQIFFWIISLALSVYAVLVVVTTTASSTCKIDERLTAVNGLDRYLFISD